MANIPTSSSVGHGYSMMSLLVILAVVVNEVNSAVSPITARDTPRKTLINRILDSAVSVTHSATTTSSSSTLRKTTTIPTVYNTNTTQWASLSHMDSINCNYSPTLPNYIQGVQTNLCFISADTISYMMVCGEDGITMTEYTNLQCDPHTDYSGVRLNVTLPYGCSMDESTQESTPYYFDIMCFQGSDPYQTLPAPYVTQPYFYDPTCASGASTSTGNGIAAWDGFPNEVCLNYPTVNESYFHTFPTYTKYNGLDCKASQKSFTGSFDQNCVPTDTNTNTSNPSDDSLSSTYTTTTLINPQYYTKGQGFYYYNYVEGENCQGDPLYYFGFENGVCMPFSPTESIVVSCSADGGVLYSVYLGDTECRSTPMTTFYLLSCEYETSNEYYSQDYCTNSNSRVLPTNGKDYIYIEYFLGSDTDDATCNTNPVTFEGILNNYCINRDGQSGLFQYPNEYRYAEPDCAKSLYSTSIYQTGCVTPISASANAARDSRRQTTNPYMISASTERDTESIMRHLQANPKLQRIVAKARAQYASAGVTVMDASAQPIPGATGVDDDFGKQYPYTYTQLLHYSPSSSSSNSIAASTIAGIVIGVLLFFIIVGIACYFFIYRGLMWDGSQWVYDNDTNGGNSGFRKTTAMSEREENDQL